MQTILNETKYARQILATGKIDKKPTVTLFVLAKYFRHKLELDQTQAAAMLHDFMRMYYPDYHAALWETTIENITKKSIKYKLRELDSITITDHELECIRRLEKPVYERLVFVLLCHAKLYDHVSDHNQSWANIGIPELFRLARVTVRHRNDKYLYLNDIESRQVDGDALISFSRKNDNLNIRVNFCTDKGNPVLTIDDLREPGYEYMNYCGLGKFIRCQICHRLVKIKSAHDFSTKYCSDCKKERELELARKRIQKHRSSPV